jgi:PAS domain S-box-containing protein
VENQIQRPEPETLNLGEHERLLAEIARLEKANQQLRDENMRRQQEREKIEAEHQQQKAQLERTLDEMRERAAHADESRITLEALMKYIPEGVTIADAPDVNIRMVSRFGRELTGRTREELENISMEEHPQYWQVYDPLTGELVPGARLPLSRATLHGEVIENEELIMRRANGEEITVLCNAGPVRDSQGKITAGIIAWRDITQKKRMEDKLAYQASLLDQIHDTIIATDAELKITAWNRAAEQVYGYTEEEVLGRIPNEVLKSEFDDEQRASALKQIAETGSFTIEVVQYTRDGRRLVMEGISIPQRDRQGSITGYVSAARDITQRKQAEEKLRVTAAQLEKTNQELKEFAFIASHDLKEPLRKIKNFGELLANRCAPQLDEAGTQYLDRIIDASRRMQEMIDSLLELSRVSTHTQPFESVDLDRVVRDVVSDLEYSLRESEVVVKVDPLRVVDADPRQMRQLFQRLLRNAIKFRHKERPLQVHIRCLDEGQDLTWLRLGVEDNGIGFEPRDAEKIFQPFTRLHPKGNYDGLGMGLSICRRIVERHGGKISAEGIPGQGASFWITLPIHQNVLAK